MLCHCYVRWSHGDGSYLLCSLSVVFMACLLLTKLERYAHYKSTCCLKLASQLLLLFLLFRRIERQEYGTFVDRALLQITVTLPIRHHLLLEEREPTACAHAEFTRLLKPAIKDIPE